MLNSFEAMQANTAETSVIGSMLIDDSTVPLLLQELSADDFADGDCRHMFEAVQAIFLERGKVDSTTVLGKLQDEGYAKKLYAIMDLTPTAANCMQYAKILRDRRLLRQIQESCFRIVGDGVDLESAKQMLAEAAGLLVERQSDRDRSYAELIADFIRRQDDKTPPDHLDWGIKALNEKLHLGPGKFVILGADSSVGKTALALQFALHIARSGKKVGFFSYETTLPDATDRLVSNDADVSLGRSKGKHLTREEIEKVIAAGGRSSKVDLRLLETARYTVENIRAKTISRGFQVIFVDYVQLIPSRKRDRYEAITDVSIALHALAQELGVTVVGLSQVTVPETDKKGRRRYISPDDLRESRQLKQDADVILLLDLVDPNERDGNRVLQISKNRDGPLAHLILSFNPSRMRFEYVEPVKDPQEERSEDRIEKMDANREKKAAARAAAAEAKKAQSSIFTELDGEEEGDLPF